MSATAITAAVVRTGGAPFELSTLELADLQADEVRVRIAASGICHTDLLVRDGSFPTPMPVVLGHEGAGVVEEVGTAVTRVAATSTRSTRRPTTRSRARWSSRSFG
jgi:aryl-alcohol dehydrogenase